MTPDLVFQFANSFVLLGWILLIFFPNWTYSQKAVLYGVVLLLAVVYAGLVLPTLSHFDPEMFSTLANVKLLFQDDGALTAGWVHYLAFDLFVGAYIVKEALSINMARWKYTICLPFTFMFGPIGLLLFYIFRMLSREE